MSSELIIPRAPQVVRLHKNDNVVVARLPLAEQTNVASEHMVCRQAIAAGHKVATRDILSGSEIRKYNQIIGFASEDISAGDHVHTHNCAMKSFQRDYAVASDCQDTEFFPVDQRATFQGYVRSDGKVGTRNYIGVLTTVNCSATVARKIADSFQGEVLKDFPQVDGVVALVHNTGCGMASDGEGLDTLQRTLFGYLNHPNFAGVLLVGLGCESSQISYLNQRYQLDESDAFQFMTIQQYGGTRRSIDEGVKRIQTMLERANQAQRQTVDASHLCVALQCGGSDAYSGITANPALGAAVDLVVRHGGTAILAETPEIYGAEHLLTRRAVSTEVADKLIERIRWWENYTERNHGNMDNNPSPGNKAGGLTTILEKSLGSAAKGGTTNLTAVYKYAEQVTEKGFVFMDSPGYDPASVTGEVASGANLVCFTTGRGSVFGFKPVPSIKLATNTAMFERMNEDMDLNCGVILDQGVSLQDMGEQIFQYFLDVASGQPSKSEALGFGDNEFTPWVVGAVM